MRKFLANLFMTVMTVCCFVSFASITEAASVALLPLVTNVERAEEASSTYIANAVQCVKSAGNFSLIDSDDLTAVVDKNLNADLPPTAEQLRAIANEAGIDLVVAMQLDVLDSREKYGLYEETITLNLQGYCYSYNALTGKYAKHRIYDDVETELAAVARSDFQMLHWGRNVKREMNKVLGVKKIKVEKPRLGW